jgi:putative aldouronate transport system permease protein
VRRGVGESVFDVANHLFLIGLCLTVIYPFWSVILTSFADAEDTVFLGFRLWIDSWNLNAYRYALSGYGNVPVAYMNTTLRVAFATPAALFVTLLAAYPLSKRRIPGRTAMTIYILIPMFFNGGLIPTYLLVRSIGLLNTRLAWVLPVMVNSFYVILTRNFLMTIDGAVEESALIDGANYLQILTRIIIPVAKPLIMTLTLWIAVFHWNEWFFALIYVRDDSKVVLQVLLRRMIQSLELAEDEFASEVAGDLPAPSVQAAVIILTIGPIVFFYPFIQKHFVKGVMLGSVKG